MFTQSKKLKFLLPLLTLTTITACSSEESSTSSQLNWATCEDADAAFECTTVDVPPDYSAPDGAQIDIAVIRHRATGDDRLGSLFVNFGGAAGRGVEDVKVIIEERLLPSSILSAYDIVGFNPRGARGSSPVDCSDVADINFNPYPSDADAIAELHANYVQFSAACQAKYGEYLQQIGSMNTAHDLEQIRIALGDEKVNFLAYSFASRVAALFMQEFPESTGRMVLDGSVSPDSSRRIMLTDPLPLMQASLLSVLAECKTDNPECEPEALIDTLAQRLNALASENTEASQLEFEIVFIVLSASVEDPELGKFIAADLVDYINTFDITTLAALVGLDDEDNAENEGMIGDDGITADIATLCADDAYRPTVDELVVSLTDFNAQSNVFGEISASEYASCAGWPEAALPVAPITTNTAPVSIVIGGSNDAIAPIGLSEEMAAAIGGVFISSDHEGHVSVFLDKSDCVDDIVETFFMEGTTPSETQCSR